MSGWASEDRMLMYKRFKATKGFRTYFILYKEQILKLSLHKRTVYTL